MPQEPDRWPRVPAVAERTRDYQIAGEMRDAVNVQARRKFKIAWNSFNRSLMVQVCLSTLYGVTRSCTIPPVFRFTDLCSKPGPASNKLNPIKGFCKSLDLEPSLIKSRNKYALKRIRPCQARQASEKLLRPFAWSLDKWLLLRRSTLRSKTP